LEATVKQDFKGIETKTAGLHDHRVTDPVDYLTQMALRGGDPDKIETAKVPILPCSLLGPVVDLVGIDPELLAAINEIECHADRNEIEARTTGIFDVWAPPEIQRHSVGSARRGCGLLTIKTFRCCRVGKDDTIRGPPRISIRGVVGWGYATFRYLTFSETRPPHFVSVHNPDTSRKIFM
jgi:hypothetical protein